MYLCQMVLAVHSWYTMLSVIMAKAIIGEKSEPFHTENNLSPNSYFTERDL